MTLPYDDQNRQNAFLHSSNAPLAGILIGYGRTPPGKTDWKRYLDTAITLHIDTSKFGFKKTPLYFTSLGGYGYHWSVIGATAIYHPTPTGFDVYMYNNFSGYPLTPENAKKWGLHINWFAIYDPSLTSP